MSSLDPFHLHPILRAPLGFDRNTVFPSPPQSPVERNLPLPASDLPRNTCQAPPVNEPLATHSSVVSNASLVSSTSADAVSDLLLRRDAVRPATPSSVGSGSRRSKTRKSSSSKAMREGKEYDALRVNPSATLKHAVFYRTVLASQGDDAELPEDDPTGFSLGDVYIAKNISNPEKPTYQGWICAIPNDPKGKATQTSQIWCQVPIHNLDEDIPHPNYTIPLFLVFHEDTEKPSWVLHDTLKRYRQAEAKKAMAAKYLGAFPSTPTRKKGRKV